MRKGSSDAAQSHCWESSGTKPGAVANSTWGFRHFHKRLENATLARLRQRQFIDCDIIGESGKTSRINRFHEVAVATYGPSRLVFNRESI